MTILVCPLSHAADMIALRRASPLARPNERLIALADAALRRNGRMRAAIVETGRGLPTVHDGAEGEPFEMPWRFQPGGAVKR